MRPAERAASAPLDPATADQSTVTTPLLDWYDRHARRLPWRVGPKDRALGVRPDPYHVWLSEVMLQQTTVAAVKSYFERFVSKWPTVLDLAAADIDDVMRAWAGLGYYSRARNLKATADAVAAAGGRFPETASELRVLPGIGDYTAAAIAAIAFDQAEPVVDGNVERVIARLFAIDDPLPGAKSLIRHYQAELTPLARAGDYAQAMMDLGATICTPKRPACSLCPVNKSCRAFALGDVETYPVKAAKKDRPVRYGCAYVAVREDGAVLLRKRPSKGLLGGMAEVPGSAWSADTAIQDKSAPLDLDWRKVPGKVVHVFTHFRLELDVLTGNANQQLAPPEGNWWSSPDQIPGEALPSVMKKVVEAALPGATKRKA